MYKLHQQVLDGIEASGKRPSDPETSIHDEAGRQVLCKHLLQSYRSILSNSVGKTQAAKSATTKKVLEMKKAIERFHCSLV
jgi:hypothetical protein